MCCVQGDILKAIRSEARNKYIKKRLWVWKIRMEPKEHIFYSGGGVVPNWDIFAFSFYHQILK